MLSHVGPGSTVHFTSLSSASLESLRQSLSSSTSEPRAAFELHTASITTLAEQRGIPLSSICLLDPRANLCLHASDAGKHPAPPADAASEKADGPFTHFLYGGILGDDPPRDRTASLRVLGFPGRHLGKIQMTTDTALGVTKRIVEDGKGMGEQEGPRGLGPNGALEWVEYPDLDFGHGESVSAGKECNGPRALIASESTDADILAPLPSRRSRCPSGTSATSLLPAASRSRSCLQGCGNTSRRTWTAPLNSR